MNKKTVLLITAIMLVICLCICILGILIISTFYKIPEIINNTTISTESPTTISPTMPTTQGAKDKPNINNINPITMTIEDLYNSNLTFIQDTTSGNIPELEWLNYIITSAIDNGWDGSESMKLPVNAKSIPLTMLNGLKAKNASYEERGVFPQEMEKYYLGSTQENVLLQLGKSARNEYIAYLQKKGVNSKYINEINDNALPTNITNIFYYGVTNPQDNPSQTQTLIGADGNKDDYSKMQIEFYAYDIYNYTRHFTSLGLLGPEPAKGTPEYDAYYIKARNIGLRYLMYHEMTHVLQRVVDSTNVPADKKQLKGNWSSATKSLFKMDNKYYIKWSDSEIITDVENHAMSQESQAEGVSYEILTTVYNMSDIQKQIAWEGMFGRLDKFRDEYDHAVNLILAKKAKIDITTIDTKIYKDVISQLTPGDEDSSVFYQTNKKLGNLPAYRGYLHPRLPQDMPVLWDYLKD